MLIQIAAVYIKFSRYLLALLNFCRSQFLSFILIAARYFHRSAQFTMFVLKGTQLEKDVVSKCGAY